MADAPQTPTQAGKADLVQYLVPGWGSRAAQRAGDPLFSAGSDRDQRYTIAPATKNILRIWTKGVADVYLGSSVRSSARRRHPGNSLQFWRVRGDEHGGHRSGCR